MAKSKNATYYVVYSFSSQTGSVTGTIFMTFSNPATFNLQRTRDFIAKSGIKPVGNVIILSWKKLSKAEEKLNVIG